MPFSRMTMISPACGVGTNGETSLGRRGYVLRGDHAIGGGAGAAHVLIDPARTAAPKRHDAFAAAAQFDLPVHLDARYSTGRWRARLRRGRGFAVHHEVLNAAGIFQRVDVGADEAAFSGLADAVVIAALSRGSPGRGIRA